MVSIYNITILKLLKCNIKKKKMKSLKISQIIIEEKAYKWAIGEEKFLQIYNQKKI